MQDQAVTIDIQQRVKMFYRIEKIMQDQVLWLGLRTDPDLWAANKRLVNLQLSAVDNFWNASEWDVTE